MITIGDFKAFYYVAKKEKLDREAQDNNFIAGTSKKKKRLHDMPGYKRRRLAS